MENVFKATLQNGNILMLINAAQRSVFIWSMFGEVQKILSSYYKGTIVIGPRTAGADWEKFL